MAVQDAELKLKVSLDLAFFRQQLLGLGQAAAGTSVPVQIKFDRKQIADEYRLLNRYISGKEFKVLINSNLKTEIDNADKLAAAIGRVQQIARGTKGALPIGTQALGLKKRPGQPGATEIKALYEALAMAGVEGFERGTKKNRAQMVTAIGSVGRDTVEGLLNGLSSQNTQLQKAAQSLGKDLIASIKGVLGIASPSREFRKIGENVGQGFQQGMLSSMDKAFDAVEDLMRARMRMLDTIARGVFRFVGMDPAALRAEAAQRRALPGVNFPATVPQRNASIGPSSTGRILPAGAPLTAGMIGGARSPFGLLPSMSGRSQTSAIVEALIAQQGPRLLPSGGGKLVDTKRIYAALQKQLDEILQRTFTVIEVDVQETSGSIKNSLRAFSYLVQALKDAENRAKNARIANEVDNLIDRLESSIRAASARAQIRQVQIGLAASPQKLLPAPRALLPAAGETGKNRVRITTGAVLGQPGFMRAPSIPSPIGRGGGGGAQPPGGGISGLGGAGGFGRATGGLGSLPGAGMVRELGDEFGMATKQVLLFGTAYKALAFATSFPAQVGQAVAALQSFRNTLLSVTGSANAAADANEFILAAVDKYSIPLQSARDGFTKLFASMEPAGFAAGEIQNLFLGISKAAATYGLSADKVDRVNYAFAQMASKGQVMSEELKGQLGDVLPGAMGIFAEAAGFKGPDAIQKFGKALEDGVYKGGKMRELLRNVALEMNKEFGPGAEGAAKTFQGAMNRMQTATQKLYESFEPAAIGVLNTVAVPLVSTIKNLTDGVNAYFSGQKAATPAAQGFADVLKTLVPTLSGIGENLKYVFQQVSVLVQGFGAVALQVSRLLALPIVRYLASTYVQVLLLTTTFKALAASGIGAAVVAIAQFIARGVVYTQVMLGMRLATQQTTVAMNQFDITLRTVMIKSVVGVALVAIGALIGRILELRGQLSAISGDAKSMEDLAKSSAKLGDVNATKEAVSNIKSRIATYKKLREEIKGAKKIESGGSAFSDRGAINTGIEVSKETALRLVELGIITSKSLSKTSKGYSILEGDLQEINKKIDTNIQSFEKAGQKGGIYVDQAIRQSNKLKQVSAGAAEGEDATKKTNLESYYSLQDQLAKAQTQADIDRIQDKFDQEFKLLNAYYDLQDARANSFQKVTIAFQKELLAIEQERQQSAMKAQAEVLKAQGSVEGGVPSAPSLPPPQGGKGAFDTGMRTGPSSAIGGSAAYHQDIMFGSTVSMKERVQLMDQLAQGYEKIGRTIEFSNAGVSGERYRSSMPYEAKSSLISRAQAAHANRPGGSGRAAMDFYAPIASSNRFGTSVEGQAMLAPSVEGASYSYGGGGRAGRTMTATRNGAMVYQQLHGSMAVPLQAGAPRPVKGSEKRETLASQATANALRRQATTDLYAEQLAVEKTTIAYAKYVASIAPTAEQELQNSLLTKRIELMSSGVTGDFLETQMKIFEAEEKTRIAGELLDKTNAKQLKGYNELKAAMPGYIASLQAAAIAQQDLSFATAQSELARREAMAQALTPDAELRVELAQKYPGNLAMQEEEFSRTKLVQGMEKTKQDLQNIASSIGDAFGSAFKGIVTGSSTAQQALANFFQSVGDAFSDMAAQMIKKWVEMQIIGLAQNLLSPLGGGLSQIFGAGASSFNPSAFSGPALSPGAGFGAGGAPSFSSIFSGGQAAFNPSAFSMPRFANGGIVTGPTLGLVGEGRYNEAIIPMPNGKSVPVELSGAMGSPITSNIVVNVSSDGKTSSSNTGSDSAGLGRRLEGAVKQVIVDELRPGGLLSGRR